MLYVEDVRCGVFADMAVGLNAESPTDRAIAPPMMLDFSLIDFFSVIYFSFREPVLAASAALFNMYIL